MRVRTRGRQALTALAMATTAVLPTVLVAPAAHADEIDDLQHRAAQISQQITDLQNKITADGNALEKARYRASQIDAQIVRAKADLARARRVEAADRKDLAAYAMQAYVNGGSGGADLSSVLNSRPSEIGQRQGYLSSAVGDRQQLVDELQASQQVSHERAASLSHARRAAADLQARTEARQKSAQQAADRLASVKAGLDGRLGLLVAQKQAAAQRAAEERARAQAVAAAAAAAQRSPATTTTPTTAGVPPVTERPAAPGTPAAGTPPPAPAPPPVRPTPPPVSSPPPSSSGGSTFVPPPNASAASVAIAAAQSQLGVRYVYGAASPGVGFDCSGLTMWAYAQAGVHLAHLTYTQETQGRVVPLAQIQPGDLVFYYGGEHVALYVGGGSVIHAPHTGDVVRYAGLYMSAPTLVVRPTG